MSAAGASVPTVPGGVSLYVHVPFCASKCAYCDFTSRVLDPTHAEGRVALDTYVSAVLREMRAWDERGVLAQVPTIYFGGGTPTILGERLPGLVREVLALPGLCVDAEVTCEANPDFLDISVAHALAEAGVTRVSLGVQSFDDAVLRWLGRRHDAGRALAAAAALRASGLEFSLDLMCGVPVQSRRSWGESVATAISTGAAHVSVYPLSVERSTPLGRRVERGQAPAPDADEAAEHMLHAASTLRVAGFGRYEVASYARPGHECRHNIRYWSGGAYLGIGPGSASMLPGEAVSAQAVRVRFSTTASIERFLARDLSMADPPGSGGSETLTAEEALREDAMLGLRLARGISAELAMRAGVTHVLEDLARLGLIEWAEDPDGGRFRTTERGWLLGNELFGRVWAGE